MPYLKSRLSLYFIFWGTFFLLGQIQRFVLLFLSLEQTQEIPVLILAQSFLVGSRFDGAIAAYFTIPLVLISFILQFFKLKFEKKFLLSYFVFFSSIYTFLLVSEIEYFSYFNTRFTAHVFNIEGNASFILSMIWESYPVIWAMIFIFAFVGFAFIILNKLIKNKLVTFTNPLNFLGLFIIVAFLLFISARGTLEYLSPLRWGHAFFSSYPFANKLALNGVFSLATDFRGKTQSLNELFTKVNSGYFSDHKEALVSTLKYIDPQVKISKEYRSGFQRTFSSFKKEKKFNVVLIIAETFANSYLKKFNGKNGMLDIAPNFRKLKKRGYFFNNYFANGYETNIGLFSSISGMPHNYGRPIMKRTDAQFPRVSLASILKNKKYHTLFMVPHDPHFDNMYGYLKNNGYNQVISAFDFANEDRISVFGVPDHFIFDRAISEMKKLDKKKKPFLVTILTSTNHVPFVVPEVEGYKPIGQEKTIIRTFHYMDWAINRFLKASQKINAFKNTIFVIAGDHGTYMPSKGHDFHLSLVNVPLLFYAPQIIPQGSSDLYSYQADLMPSILHWLNLNYKAPIFGRNIFQKQKHNYAFFQQGNMLGFVENDWYLIDRIGAKSSLFNLKAKNPFLDISAEKPLLFNQMRKRVRALFLSTNDVLLSRKNIFYSN